MTNEESNNADSASFSTDLLERILPCPFCGGDRIGIRYEGQPAMRYAFLCCDCGGTTGSVCVGGTATGSHVIFDNEEAIRTWNMRSNASYSANPPHNTISD